MHSFRLTKRLHVTEIFLVILATTLLFTIAPRPANPRAGKAQSQKTATIQPETVAESEPLWLFAAGTPAGEEVAQFDGVALTNFSTNPATVDLEIFAPLAPASSTTQSFPQGSGNQNSLDLLPGQQVARLRANLFGGDPSTPAWIELTGDTAEIGTFFQFGTCQQL